MKSCICPITNKTFEDPVVGDDGHTYERKAITEWLTKNPTSPMTRQPMDIASLRTNYIVKHMIDELRSGELAQQTQYRYKLDVDISRTRREPLYQGFGTTIYEVEWINQDGPPIILLTIDGAKAKQEASFYIQLSCHPYIVRTFGLVQSDPGSVMLLQESAPHGDLSELFRENGFKPNEAVLWEIFRQICDAMICLADNGIVHGDLACRNILVFQMHPTNPKENLVKLTGFGLTRESKLYSIVDSPISTTMTIIPVRYAAPEIFDNSNKSSYSEKSDVYSMGVLMWEACSYGQTPYSTLESDEAIRQCKLNDEKLPRPSCCSRQLWSIMNDCWQKEPSNRPTFKTLNESLLTIQNEARFSEQQKLSTRVNPNAERAATNLQNSPDDIIYIPCEVCDELIDPSNLFHHTERCIKAEETQLESHRRQQRWTLIPVQIHRDYCKKPFLADQSKAHEMYHSAKPSSWPSEISDREHQSNLNTQQILSGSSQLLSTVKVENRGQNSTDHISMGCTIYSHVRQETDQNTQNMHSVPQYPLVSCDVPNEKYRSELCVPIIPQHCEIPCDIITERF